MPLKIRMKAGESSFITTNLYFNEFAEEPKLSLEELVKKLRGERDNFTTTPRWLEWIKNERVARYYELARSGILEKYGTG